MSYTIHGVILGVLPCDGAHLVLSILLGMGHALPSLTQEQEILPPPPEWNLPDTVLENTQKSVTWETSTPENSTLKAALSSSEVYKSDGSETFTF